MILSFSITLQGSSILFCFVVSIGANRTPWYLVHFVKGEHQTISMGHILFNRLLRRAGLYLATLWSPKARASCKLLCLLELSSFVKISVALLLRRKTTYSALGQGHGLLRTCIITLTRFYGKYLMAASSAAASKVSIHKGGVTVLGVEGRDSASKCCCHYWGATVAPLGSHIFPCLFWKI